MKYGKLTQTAWMRSVRRQLHIEGQKTLFRPSPFETCSGLLCGSGDPAGNGALPGDAVKGAGADGEKCFLWADAHASGTSPQTGYYAVLQAAGELAAKGVSPCGRCIAVCPIGDDRCPSPTDEAIDLIRSYVKPV